MEIWLQQQANAVFTALAHAQELYGNTAAPAAAAVDLEPKTP